MFGALNSLRLGLPNNDTGQIDSSITLIQNATEQLNVEEALYGNVEQRIGNATSYAATRSTSLQTQLSQIQDADAASAALQLTQDNTQLQAAFEMQAGLPTKSLFSYLW